MPTQSSIIDNPTHIGIIGAGAIGQAMAKQVVRAGLSVTLSNSRGPASLAGIIEQLGPKARAGSVGDAATADIVFLSVTWEHLQSALADLRQGRAEVKEAGKGFSLFKKG